MREREMNFSERLLDAFGMIDDGIIQASQSPYRPSTKKMMRFSKLIATMSLVLVCAMGLLIAVEVIDGVDGDGGANVQDEYSVSLEETLLSVKDSAPRVSEDSIDMFDGAMSLIWQYSGENEYCVLKVSGYADAANIKRAISSSASSTTMFDEDKELECSVWICYGNGEIVSPYLKSSPGNVGYGKLFSYSPEIEPSERICDVIDDLIS